MNQLTLLCFLVLSSLLFACHSKNQNPNEPTISSNSYKYGEQPIKHRYLEPYKIDENEKYPLVIFLHGAGERGSDNESQLVHIANIFLDEELRKVYPAYVIFPQCPKEEYWANVKIDRKKGIWTPDFNQPFTLPLRKVRSLISNLVKEHQIDKNRIYVAGLSMGGFGTLDLLSRPPNFVAAAIAICGGGDTSLVHNYKDIPLKIFHGAKDPVVPVELSRDLNQALIKVNGKHQYIEYPEGDHLVWNQAFEEEWLIPWLFAQKKI